jgi:predicted signal transduction protein with EAL and GGDEF domain
VVARLGGDEFAVLLEGVSDEGMPAALAGRLAAALRAPIDLDGREVFTAASVGIALSGPGRDGPEELLRAADLAMYRAKAEGKGRSAVFEPSMDEAAVERLALETDLRHALERGELRLHYQPIVELGTGTVREVEALLRWEHPRRGLIPPISFIPIAEETGLIVPIGRWIIEEACRQLRAWDLAHRERQPLAIAVNLSARQLRDPDLVGDVDRALHACGLAPARLRLEITEDVLVEDTAAAAAALVRLKALGVGLAIDDFGTGYASLGYLKRLPVDMLKIDRSFVEGLGREERDSAIVQGVLSLAGNLRLEVTGEGIETAEQLERLRALGCDLGQGFYFARPLTAERVSELLAGEAPMLGLARRSADTAA